MLYTNLDTSAISSPMHVSYYLISWHPQCSDTPRLPDWRTFHDSNAHSRSSILIAYSFFLTWNQHDWYFLTTPKCASRRWMMRMSICVCVYVIVCSGIQYMFSWLISRVSFGAVCKQSLSISSTVSMQEEAEAKRKKAEARCPCCHDTWHVKGGCWNAWMKDQRARNCG